MDLGNQYIDKRTGWRMLYFKQIDERYRMLLNMFNLR